MEVGCCLGWSNHYPGTVDWRLDLWRWRENSNQFRGSLYNYYTLVAGYVGDDLWWLWLAEISTRFCRERQSQTIGSIDHLTHSKKYLSWVLLNFTSLLEEEIVRNNAVIGSMVGWIGYRMRKRVVLIAVLINGVQSLASLRTAWFRGCYGCWLGLADRLSFEGVVESWGVGVRWDRRSHKVWCICSGTELFRARSSRFFFRASCKQLAWGQM